MIYDTSLFIDIIEGDPRIGFLRSDYKDGYHIRFYDSHVTGKLVMIDTTDEDMLPSLQRSYLLQLGLSDLIPMMFPEN